MKYFKEGLAVPKAGSRGWSPCLLTRSSIIVMTIMSIQMIISRQRFKGLSCVMTMRIKTIILRWRFKRRSCDDNTMNLLACCRFSLAETPFSSPTWLVLLLSFTFNLLLLSFLQFLSLSLCLCECFNLSVFLQSKLNMNMREDSHTDDKLCLISLHATHHLFF